MLNWVERKRSSKDTLVFIARDGPFTCAIYKREDDSTYTWQIHSDVGFEGKAKEWKLLQETKQDCESALSQLRVRA